MKNFWTKKCKINKTSTYFKGYVSSYNVEISSYFNSKLRFKYNESAIKNKLKQSLTKLRGFKFVATLVWVLKKIESDDKTKYGPYHLRSKAETIINQSDIYDVFESIYSPITSNIQKSLGKGSGWIIDSVIEHNINISKYNLLPGVSYIKLPQK